MNRIINKTAHLAAIAAIAVSAAACSSKENNGGGVPDDTLYDIVTLDPASASAQGSVFTFRRWGDSPLITLVSPLKVDSKVVKPGERLMIAYTPAEGNSVDHSGGIDLYAYMTVLNGSVSIATDVETASWSTESLNIYSLWPSGNYINIHSGLRIDQPPVKFEIVADEATVDDAMPDLYVLYKAGDGNEGNLVNYYASFDISEVLERPNCQGVNIYAANSYGTTRKWTFRRGETAPPSDGE